MESPNGLLSLSRTTSCREDKERKTIDAECGGEEGDEEVGAVGEMVKVEREEMEGEEILERDREARSIGGSQMITAGGSAFTLFPERRKQIPGEVVR